MSLPLIHVRETWTLRGKRKPAREHANLLRFADGNESVPRALYSPFGLTRVTCPIFRPGRVSSLP
jgi:hypothetical protein